MNWTTYKLGARLALYQVKEFLSSCKRRQLSWAKRHLAYGILLFFDTCVALIGHKDIECPVCGWQSPQFFHYLSACEPHLRRNAMCPQCGALERQRDIVSWLKKKGDRYSSVLNVAPDPGLTKFLTTRPGSFVIILDLSKSNVTVRMDLHNLGFVTECFDLIVCSHVLEHVQDDIRCIAELFRVLKPNGIAILPVSMRDTECTIEFGSPKKTGHVREYGHDYYKRLVNTGFLLIPGAQHIAAVTKQNSSSR